MKEALTLPAVRSNNSSNNALATTTGRVSLSLSVSLCLCLFLSMQSGASWVVTGP